MSPAAVLEVSAIEFSELVGLRMSESVWQSHVLGLASEQGWLTAHFRPALRQSGKWSTAVQGDGKGFPDLVLVRDTRLIFAELKRQRAPSPKPGDDQDRWLQRLARVPFNEVYLWRPNDRAEVIRVLSSGESLPGPPLRTQVVPGSPYPRSGSVRR